MIIAFLFQKWNRKAFFSFLEQKMILIGKICFKNEKTRRFLLKFQKIILQTLKFQPSKYWHGICIISLAVMIRAVYDLHDLIRERRYILSVTKEITMIEKGKMNDNKKI